MHRALPVVFLLATLPPPARAIQQCDCGCCHSALRPPSLQVNLAQTMCISNFESDYCEDLCQVGEMNTVASSTDNGEIETGRYCMMDCLPISNELDSECSELTERLTRKLLTSDGNGADPAMLRQPGAMVIPEELPASETTPPAPPPPRPRVEIPSRDPTLPQEDDFQAAASAAMTGGALRGTRSVENAAALANLADAAGKRAFAAALDARSGRVETGSAISVVNSTADFRKARLQANIANDVKAKLEAAAVRAQIYARSAAESNARALKEVQEMRAAPAQIAQEVASYAVAKLRRQAAEWRATEQAEEEVLAPTHAPLTEAGTEAMVPYRAAYQRSLVSKMNFEEEAHRKNEEAHNLQQGAKMLAGQAVAYNHAGNGKLARQMMAQAKGMLDKAKRVDVQAQKEYATAEKLNLGLGAFEENAEIAGERASALSRQYWMPPPVPQISGAAGPGPAPAPR